MPGWNRGAEFTEAAGQRPSDRARDDSRGWLRRLLFLAELRGSEDTHVMRGLLITGLLLLAVVPRTLTTLAQTALPSAEPTAARAADTEGSTMTDAQLLAQAGAIGVLAVVLFFYRRDFMMKNDAEVRRTTEVIEVLKASNEAVTEGAVATARQTDATHRLARAVENIERRQAGLPPSSRVSGEPT